MKICVCCQYLILLFTGCLLLFSVCECTPQKLLELGNISKDPVTERSLDIEHLDKERIQNKSIPSFRNKNIQQKELETFLIKDVSSFLKILSQLLKHLKEEVTKNPIKNEKCCKNHLKPIDTGTQIVLNLEEDEEITLTSLLYKEAGPWSPCRRSCYTSRIRKCRVQHLCTADVLIEEALCYTHGSKCENKVSQIIEEAENTNRIKEESKKNVINEEEMEEAMYEYTGGTDEDNYNTQEQEEKKEIDIYYTPEGEKIDPAETNDYHYYFSYTDEGEPEEPGEKNSDDYHFHYEHTDDYHEEVEYKDEIKGKKKKSKKKTSSKGKKDHPIEENEECGVSQVAIPYKMFRIIGGSEAMKGSWPWQVAILNRYKEVFCGGTIIASRWVLTAAHCVKKKLYVRVGEHNLAYSDGEMEMKVINSFPHPDFDFETIDSDIALLELSEDVFHEGPKHIRPVCLPPAGELLPKKKNCVVLGWGKERESHVFGSDVLRYAKVPIAGTRACKKAYADYILTENMFCAGYLSGGVDSCSGDSGGPLLCKNNHDQWVLHGVTSFGDGCGEKGRLGVYTKVVNYVTWIHEIMHLNK